MLKVKMGALRLGPALAYLTGLVTFQSTDNQCDGRRPGKKGDRPYLKAIGDVEFRGGDPHQVVHQHHDHDGDEHGKVADG